MESSNLTISQSVVVKAGITDPDTGNDIGGWRGRFKAIFDEVDIVTIQWDSLTLKSIPQAHIAAVKHKHGVHELPLCDLKATEADAEICQLVDDYAVWFANH